METKRVLVIDDQPGVRQLLQAFLTENGYDVAGASNGAEGLREVEQDPPSFILLDLIMPEMDGRQFAHELSARGMHVPTIVMSGDHDAQQWAQGIGAPYLPKPFTHAELDAALAHVGGPQRLGSSLIMDSRW
ncbi:MAG TPA: response regulator [Chloroflexota bacterium]|jgi:DNA-binding response OmpR family regulator|nr:response regulator [Chloroflexota bacterium]